MRITITIPEDEELYGAVLDDVDDDGRSYHRCIEGPATLTAELYDDERFWFVESEALAIDDDDLPSTWIQPLNEPERNLHND